MNFLLLLLGLVDRCGAQETVCGRFVQSWIITRVLIGLRTDGETSTLLSS